MLDLGLGYFETLDLEEPARNMLKDMRASLESGKQLIADVLDLSALRVGGGLPHKRERCDVREIVAEVIREAQAIHPDREIALEIEGAPREIYGDPDRLWQLTNNLVRNAAQHSDAKSPIDVAVRFERDDVVIEVHNVGAAIPESVVPALVEPMTRGDALEQQQSIGLGLYIVD